MPVVPFFIIFAAYAVYWLIDKATSKDFKPVVISFIALGLAAVPFNIKMVHQDLAVSYNNLALIYKKQHMYNEAIEEFKESIRINPNLAGVRYNLGMLYYKSGNLDNSIEMLKKAAEINPDTTIFYRKLGFAYANKGLLPQAKEAWKRAVELDQSQQDLLVNIEKIKGMGY